MAANIQANNVCKHVWDKHKEERRERGEARRVSNLNQSKRKLLTTKKGK